MRTTRLSLSAAVWFALISLVACGGGGSSSSSSTLTSGGGGQTQALTIATAAILPGTLQNHAYSTTLAATGGQGAYHWSIAPVSSTALFVNGLSIDSATGVLSGTANFAGTGGFVATVTDSGSPAKSTTKGFYVTAYQALTAGPPQSVRFFEYQSSQFAQLAVSGGVPPLSYSVSGGSLPAGIKLGSNGQLSGAPYTAGTYNFSVAVQDSFSPPEAVTLPVTISVIAPALQMAVTPTRLLLNGSFTGRFVATGGTPPYTYAIVSGSLPAGVTLTNAAAGTFSGTPTALGSYSATARVTDSSTPPLTLTNLVEMNVVQPLGRNDSPANATAIGNGTIQASISPYIDPTNGTPVPGDNDYYKLVSLGGAIVHLATAGNFPLDTVLEIVDGNGHQMATCNQPGATSTNFSSACLNDDVSSTSLDSALDFQVPGATNAATTFYAHVLDWRGDARPDMIYRLNASGLVAPLTISASNVKPAARGKAYASTLDSSNGTGTVTWSLKSGSLPPGITLSSSGNFSGSATTDGLYSFTVQATDSANPPQSVTAPIAIQVVDPVAITSPATWPDACVNQFYSFAIQTSGGVAPINYGFISNAWPAFNMTYQPAQNTYDGVFKGTSNVTGTFTGNLSAFDATGTGAFQTVTVTVKTCP